ALEREKTRPTTLGGVEDVLWINLDEHQRLFAVFVDADQMEAVHKGDISARDLLRILELHSQNGVLAFPHLPDDTVVTLVDSDLPSVNGKAPTRAQLDHGLLCIDVGAQQIATRLDACTGDQTHLRERKWPDRAL